MVTLNVIKGKRRPVLLFHALIFLLLTVIFTILLVIAATRPYLFDHHDVLEFILFSGSLGLIRGAGGLC